MIISNKRLLTLFDIFKKEHENETEFVQAVFEMFVSLDLIIDEYPQIIEQQIIEKLLVPDRIITFPVKWVNSLGQTEVNEGYRIQYNNTLGVYKGGIRFHPNVNLSIFKFLSFEQTFKNALTTLPMGGAKGGANFDPRGRSEEDIRLFSLAFGKALAPYIGQKKDVPAGDIGVGQKEVSYLVETFKEVMQSEECAYTGKPIALGGALGRKEATGYGLIYFVEEALKVHFKSTLKNKKVLISGSGNVALHAAFKASEQGAIIVGMSDSKGSLYNAQGLDLSLIKSLKDEKRLDLATYLLTKPAKYTLLPASLWSYPADIALPCATQNELDKSSVDLLIKNGVILVAEGANMPTTREGVELLLANKIMYAPGKASNAGGVLVSGLEIKQHERGIPYTFNEVDTILKTIMQNIFNDTYKISNNYGQSYNLLLGANINSFLKVALPLMKKEK